MVAVCCGHRLLLCRSCCLLWACYNSRAGKFLPITERPTIRGAAAMIPN
ncbi:unnamed protein product, partial [Mycena citricolor]